MNEFKLLPVNSVHKLSVVALGNKIFRMRMQTKLVNRAEYSAFGVEVRESANRSLEVLRDIEETIDALNRLAEKMMDDVTYAAKAIEHINGLSKRERIDADGALDANLHAAQVAVENLYEELKIKRVAAEQAPELTDDDGVADAYSKVIAISADLHKAIGLLREAIQENDINCDANVGNVFTEVDALFADMGL